jgi:Tol biopolymer transport system component/DNA-binding winged helix-turn-helix (wHTH) protein
MPAGELPRVIRFGVSELDLQTGELRRNGLRVKLQDQPFQILAMLLERPGNVVTREELRARLWPADTFVDFEHSLNAAIKRLRDALGDSAETPVFIETLPRRGYRFLIPISGNGTSVGAEVTQSGPLQRGNWSRRLPFVLVALAALIATAYVVKQEKWISSSRPLVALPLPKVVPFTSFPGRETDSAFSPDGKQIAFVRDEDPDTGTDSNVYVKLIGGEKPLRITQGAGRVCCPTWSPDGRYIAFNRCSGGPSGAYLVPSLGGPERNLTGRSACIGLSWSPDGRFLAFPNKASAGDPWRIWVFSLDTTEERPISSPPANIIGDHQPAFFSDSKSVAFRRISSPHVTDLYLASIDGGGDKRLTFDKTLVDGMAWTPDGKSIVFASHRSGDMSLWRIPVSSGTPERLPVSGTNASHPAISRQGDKLAYTTGFTHPNIWELNLNTSGRAILPAKPLIVSSMLDISPQFSPDGSKITFSSNRSGGSEIWIANADGSDLIQLTSLNVLSGTPRWSPDGRFIAFDSRPADHSHIFVIPAVGGKPRQLTDGDFEESVPNWSRDGRWIYFTSNRFGVWQLFKAPWQGGEPLQVTRRGGFAAFESTDGSALYYWKDNDYGIWKMSLPNGDERRILPIGLDWGQWSVQDNGIYFIDTTQVKPTIRFFDFVKKRITSIATVPKSLTTEVGAFDVSPDGRSILFLQVEKGGDIMLVENFH